MALTLWLIVLAGVLAADQLRETLEDGSATLALARPVSRTSFALARLVGVLSVSWSAAVFMLGAAAYLLASRHGVPFAPALGALAACALSGLTVAAWAMSISLVLPRVATTLLVFVVVGITALANSIGAGAELGGFLGQVDALGPPFAGSMIVALSPWLPEAALEGLRTDPIGTWVRLGFWAALGLGVLGYSIRRIEIGR